MKKRTSLVMFSLLVMLLHVGESNAVDQEPLIQAERLAQLGLTSAEIVWLQEHQTFRIAGPKAFPPFQYVAEDGMIGGMASDYITLLSERLGVHMEAHTDLLWPDVLQKAQNRKLEMITCAARTADREAYLLFSDPYLSFPMVIISRKDGPFISSIQDLHGKKVALIKGVSTIEWLRRDRIDLIEHLVDTPLDALKAVSVGQADAYLGNLAASSYLIEKHGLVNLKIAAPTDYGNYDLHFAVRSDWPELVSILNKTLASISPEEHNAIRQKWIAVRYEYGIDPSYIWRIAWQAGIAVAAMIVMFLLWNWQIRQSEERFRGLLEYGADMILAFKPDGTILYQSPSLTPILGYAPQELLKTSVFSLLHEADKPQWDQMLTGLLNGKGPCTFEHRLRHRQGHYLYVESNCLNLLENKALRAIVLNARDMTQRIIAEKELKRAKETALKAQHEAEAAQRASEAAQRASEAAQKASEAANIAKSTFLANMSHELRTPLNAILGFSQLLVRNPVFDAEQQEYLTIISRSGEHLLTLINDVLNMSKIEAGRITLHEQNFDIYRLLEDIEDMFHLRTKEKGIQLLFEYASDLSQYIRTDPVKLRQVLMNLVSNAIKFTEQGSVELRIANCELRNDQSEIRNLKFEIADTGPGIAPEEIPTLFEAFVQSKTGPKTHEGTGLGLPISQRFVRMMGGDLTVRSEFGHGSVFSFDIPVQVVSDSEVQPVFSQYRVVGLEPNQPRYRILVVDDKWESRHLLLKLLGSVGFEVREACNGQEALDLWAAWNPHGILMDMRMPIMDGYTATQEIRNSKFEIRNVPIIALTASSFEEERAVILAAGCDDFLRKPFRETDIFQALHKHLGVRYVYEEDTTPRKQGSPNAEALDSEMPLLVSDALAALPQPLLTRLHHAVEGVELEPTMHIITQIHAHNAPLADALTELVKQYRFDILQRLFENIKNS